MAIRTKHDTIIYIDESGVPVAAPVVVAVGPDGQPTGAVQVSARDVYTLNMISEAGVVEAAPEDENRTGATLRNDSDVQMYFTAHMDETPADGRGYPMDARRGYSFEALGLLPSGPIRVWCGVAGAKIALMYSTTSEPYNA